MTLCPPVISSARRFAEQGPLRTTLHDLLLTCAYLIHGIDRRSAPEAAPVKNEASGSTSIAMNARKGEGIYNVVVIGAGTAGLVAAAGTAGLGGRVALIERRKMGGDCLNFGCVPSKALISSARLLHAMRNAADWGIEPPHVRYLEQQVAFQRIAAPFAGVITVRNINVGDLITANSTNFEMFHIQQSNQLRVYFRVPQQEAPNIKVGQTFNVQVGARSAKTYPGTVISTSGAVSPDSRTMLVQLQVDNSNNEILPGSYGTIRLPENVLEKVLTLPDNTLIFRGKSLQVAVVDPNGAVQLRDVEAGRDFGVQSEILRGVSESDKVIVNPSDSLTNGTVVRVSTPASQGAAKPSSSPSH